MQAVTLYALSMVALVWQELVRHARSTRLLVWAVAFAALSCVVLASMWPVRTAWFDDIGRASRSMLELIAALLAATAVLIVPAYGAAAIALERERGTYDQLRLTLISPFAMIMGKLINILAIFALIVIAGLPVLGATYFLLGIDVIVLEQLLAISFVVAFSCTSLGLLCSTVCRRILLAQTLTFLLVFTLLSATGAFLSATTAPLPSNFMNSMLYKFGPAIVLQSLVAGLMTRSEVATFAAVHLIIGVAAILGATVLLAYDRRVDRMAEPRQDRPPHRTASGTPRYRPIPVFVNAVFARESRWGELITWRWQLRLFVLSCAILGTGLFSMTASLAPGIPPRAEMWVALQMVLVLFLVPGMTASTILQEHARQSMDFLMMSRMRPSSVFLGKILGVIVSCGGVLVPCILSIAFAPMMYPAITLRDAAVCVSGFVSLLVWMFVCAGASTYACAAVRRPTAAFAFSYVLSILLFCGFGTGLFAVKYYGSGTAFLSPVLGFMEKAADAGMNPLDQFNGPWMWHIFTHLVLGLVFILLALRAVEPFAMSRNQKWR